MADQSISLFGWRLVRGDEDKKQPEAQQSPITPSFEDGSINIQTGAHYGIYVDLDGSYRSELDLLTKYRTMAMQPEMENAIDDIINEAIVHDEDEVVVKMNLDELDQPDNIKKMIREEFSEVLRLMDFRRFASDIFRRWYIDGRLYYNVVIDKDNPRDGIQQLILIDPRRIRKIRNITKEKNEQGVEIITKIDVFYLYNEKVVNNNTQSPQLVGNFAGGIKLSEDSVVQITSGLFDPSKSTVLSYLHKAIRPMNQLRFVEDATVVYRVSRAPERRVFYVDVGNMPKAKAEQYLKDIMTKYRNKLTYDATTGEVRDATKHLSMLEDFWMPRRGDTNKSTEITTLPAGQNLGQMEDVLYFEKKLYRALGVPVSRLEPSQGFSLGRASEITRDEIKFDKFIQKLRAHFSMLFDELLARQLTLKGICNLDDWKDFREDIRYTFTKDNNFAELKDAELTANRLNLLTMIEPFVGRYYSKRWVQEKLLRFTESEIEQMEKQIEKEADEMAKEAENTLAAQPGVAQQPGVSPTEGGPTPLNPEQDKDEVNNRFAQQLGGGPKKP